jgi:tetratricopeptide (TPR) repeat protein
LLALVVATISGGMLLYRQDLMLQDKLVILIANFDGPDSENYRITEYLLASLKKNLNRNKEIVIKPLNKEITEQEGSEVARKTGREHRADIIVWGLYGVTETDVVVSFHMENLLNSGRDFKTKPEQGVYWFTDERPDNSIAINSDQDQITVSESGNLNSFTVQANLSSEILTIINFFSGYVQYTAGNYNEAVSLFDNAIDESRNLQSWPLKSELHFYRSNANFQLRNLEQSILDLTLAIDISEDIKLKSQYYTNRGVVNIHAGFYEDAISDYSEAIQLDPESPLLFMNYNNRGESHRNLGNYDDAIEDFTKSIQLFSEYEGPFYNRGLTYAQLGMFDKAIPDLNQAINLKPNNYDAYFVLGRIYVEMDEIDKDSARVFL